MHKLFNVDDRIYGFCNGYFGRDDYDTKKCVSVTNKYAVFVYLDGEFEGNAVVLNHQDRLDNKTVDGWKDCPYSYLERL